MKKIGVIIMACVIVLIAFAGCSNTQRENAFDENEEISTLNRESGSGTKISFINFLGLDEAILKEDSDSIVSSTEVMLSAVESEQYAIGYVSHSNITSNVKVLSIDGVSPTAQNIENNNYLFARNFNIVTKSKNTDVVAQDFLNYIVTQGDLIEEMGYVAIGDTQAYTSTKKSGKIKISGSSSIYPLMVELSKGYNEINPNAEIEINKTDSTNGIENVKNDISQIAMSSRELTDDEMVGTEHIAIAKDTIAIIVNTKNPIDNISLEQLKKIYIGKTGSWSEVK